MAYRDRDRDWDTRSARDDRPRGTTIRRYKIADNDDADDDRYESQATLKVTKEPERARSNVREYYERDVVERDTRDGRRGGREAEIRITRETDREPAPRPRSPEYELERVTRSTEYFQERQPQPIYIRTEAPQPIIIREPARQPIVIRERTPEPPRREEKEESKSEYESHRQLARREPSPEQDEDYYYERRVRRIERRPEPERDQDRDDRRSNRHHSDDDSEYYRYRKTTETYGSDSDDAPAHRRHLAEGAVAGGALAGILRHQRKKTGDDNTGRGAGIGQVAGGAALGALATEAVSRARKYYRSKSRGPRGGDDSDDERGGRRMVRGDSEERSRSRSGGGVNKADLAKLGVIAAIGAVAGYAASRRGGNKDDRRSRSRRRRGSDIAASDSDGEDGKKSHKGTIAKAGIASAAVAGIVDHIRSKSRGGRSKSKGRAAIPIAAAGLGGAAIAGLYEANKDSKRKESRRDGERGTDRSRSRSRSAAPRDRSGNALSNDQNLITYGTVRDYEGRGRRTSSESISPNRRLRSRSRGADGDMDEAGQGAWLAHQKRERIRADRARKQQEEDLIASQPAPAYGFGPYADPVPEPGPPMYPQNGYYQPAPNYSAAPPNPYSPTPNIVNHSTPHNPENYPQNPPYDPPQAPQPYYPGPQAPYPGDQGYRGPNVSFDPDRYLPVRTGDASRDVNDPERPRTPGKSVAFNLSPRSTEAGRDTTEIDGNQDSSVENLSDERQHTGVDGENRHETRERPESPDTPDNEEHDDSDSENRRRHHKDFSIGRHLNRQRRHSADAAPRSHRSRRKDDASRQDDRGRARGSGRKSRTTQHSPASDDSGETIELERTDLPGRTRDRDPVADKIEAILNGKGRLGRLLMRFSDPGGPTGRW